tara:strand:- start:1740 stop:3101 length:1362 start_codon:yes stop_codon:yes gene_type:complete
MESTNFTIESNVRFRSNAGSFDKQPLYILTDCAALTGGNFLSVYRVRQSRDQSLSITGAAAATDDGLLGMSYGDGIGLTSLTGTHRIRAQSLTSGDGGLTADWGTPAGGKVGNTLLSTTAEEVKYTITTIVDGNRQVDVVVLDENVNIYFGDMQIKAAGAMNNINAMGMGIRPLSTSYPADGGRGSGLVCQYFYNRMEKQPTFHTTGLTGIMDWGSGSVSAGIYGKAAGGMAGYYADNTVSASVTGWLHGPIEGGFMLDGSSYIETATASAFSTRHAGTSGVAIMGYVKMFSTGSDTNIFTIGACGTVLAGISVKDGSIELNINSETVSAGAVTSTSNAMAGAISMPLNQWVHIVAQAESGSGSTSGANIFINGEKTTLARSTTSVSGNINFPIINDDARLIIGKNMDRNLGGLTGVVGMTRIFNRPLSDAEVMQNFIATIPSQAVISEINIA